MAHQPEKQPRSGVIVKTPAPDSVSHIRSPSGLGYGQNDGASNPSSVDPGKRVVSPLGANLESSVGDSDLHNLISGGITKRVSGPEEPDVPGSQTRTISNKGYPPAFGMKRQQKDMS
jgi:hypothetical protein